MKTRAMLMVSPQFAMALMIGVKDGDQVRAFRVVKHALPSDASLVRVCYDARADQLLFLLESEHFRIAPDAQVHDSGYPYLDPPEMTVEIFAPAPGAGPL